MHEYNYDAFASTINIEGITSSKLNQEDILRRPKDNDPSLNRLRICGVNSTDRESHNYIPDVGEDMGWLGYYIGQHTSLRELYTNQSDTIQNSSFCKGLRCNKSIKNISLYYVDIPGGDTLQTLGQFFKNNHNLTEIEVNHCEMGTEGARWLSLALGDCAASLKCFILAYNRGIGDGQMVEIIVALSMHPQLEVLRLPGMGIGRDECTALATLLRNTTKQLQTLNLSNNNIDDEAIEVLVHSIGASELRYLILIGNRSITAKGLKALSTLLEMPESNLEELKLLYNNIGNRWPLIFTNALRGNIKLKTLAPLLNTPL